MATLHNNTVQVIDPHVHFFNPKKGNYFWLQLNHPPFWPDKRKIVKEFNLDDTSLSKGLELKGCVHIEAGFDNTDPLKEVNWLESDVFIDSLKNRTKTVRSIAFLDLTMSPERFHRSLMAFQKTRTCIGIRHIIEDSLLSTCHAESIQMNLRTLQDTNMIFELQFDAGNADHLKWVMETFGEFEKLTIVLNHFCFLHNQKDVEIKHALSLLNELANTAIKVSGFEMSNRHYTQADIVRCYEHTFTIFDQQKIMAASNFPLTLFSKTYQDYWNDIYQALQLLNVNAKDVCCYNAYRTYQMA